MKRAVLALVLVLWVLSMPRAVLAQTTNLEPGVCVGVYGGGVVCGAKHEVVPTALGDINPAILGGLFLAASASLFVISRKMRKTSKVEIS